MSREARPPLHGGELSGKTRAYGGMVGLGDRFLSHAPSVPIANAAVFLVNRHLRHSLLTDQGIPLLRVALCVQSFDVNPGYEKC